MAITSYDFIAQNKCIFFSPLEDRAVLESSEPGQQHGGPRRGDMSHREPQTAPRGRRGRHTSGWPPLRPLSPAGTGSRARRCALGSDCRLSSRPHTAGLPPAPERKANVPQGRSFLASPLQGACQRPERRRRSQKTHGCFFQTVSESVKSESLASSDSPSPEGGQAASS